MGSALTSVLSLEMMEMYIPDPVDPDKETPENRAAREQELAETVEAVREADARALQDAQKAEAEGR